MDDSLLDYLSFDHWVEWCLVKFGAPQAFVFAFLLILTVSGTITALLEAGRLLVASLLGVASGTQWFLRTFVTEGISRFAMGAVGTFLFHLDSYVLTSFSGVWDLSFSSYWLGALTPPAPALSNTVVYLGMIGTCFYTLNWGRRLSAIAFGLLTIGSSIGVLLGILMTVMGLVLLFWALLAGQPGAAVTDLSAAALLFAAPYYGMVLVLIILDRDED